MIDSKDDEEFHALWVFYDNEEEYKRAFNFLNEYIFFLKKRLGEDLYEFGEAIFVTRPKIDGMGKPTVAFKMMVKRKEELDKIV